MVLRWQLLQLRLFGKLSKLPRLLLLVALSFYLSGFQPVLGIPPIRKARVEAAELTVEQTVSSVNVGHVFSLPHPGYLSTRFSRWHPGIDLATGLGMPVHPISSGRVVEVVYGYFGLGHFVVIDHGDEIRSTYGHMGRIFVKPGEDVTASSPLGEVGMTGHTSGPHTHLEVTKQGSYTDPQSLLPILPDWPDPNSLGGLKVVPQGGGSDTQSPTKLDIKKELKVKF